MSFKLYEKNVYLDTCISQVKEIAKENGKFSVVLDQTVFSPRGGGQPGDKGTIDGHPVLGVYEKDKTIFHILNEAPSSKEVYCKIHWPHRLDMMQNHCGEHILSGIFYKEYQAANKGFHMGNDYITIDMDIQNVTDVMLRRIENIANDAIYANLPVEIRLLESMDEAQNYPLRKPLNVEEDIKIVTIPEVDCVACCGTHPHRTGEIGMIKILKAENYKRMTRIYFKCGKRALEDYRLKNESQIYLYQMFSANESNLIEKIENEGKKNQELKEQLLETKNAMYEWEVSRITEDHDFFYHQIYAFYDMDDLKRIAKMVFKCKDKLLILASLQKKGTLLCHNGSFNIHCGNIVRKYIRNTSGKGGGSDKMAQIVFNSEKDLDTFIDEILLQVKKLEEQHVR